MIKLAMILATSILLTACGSSNASDSDQVAKCTGPLVGAWSESPNANPLNMKSDCTGTYPQCGGEFTFQQNKESSGSTLITVTGTSNLGCMAPGTYDCTFSIADINGGSQNYLQLSCVGLFTNLYFSR